MSIQKINKIVKAIELVDWLHRRSFLYVNFYNPSNIVGVEPIMRLMFQYASSLVPTNVNYSYIRPNSDEIAYYLVGTLNGEVDQFNEIISELSLIQSEDDMMMLSKMEETFHEIHIFLMELRGELLKLANIYAKEIKKSKKSKKTRK